MADDLKAALVASGSAIRAQSARLRTVAENMANAYSTATTPGGDPYARKTVSFVAELDRATGAQTVRVSGTGIDRSPFRTQFDPGNRAADAEGYVKLSNVNPLVEMSDMREAHRSYEANLQVIRQSREMVSELIDLLRGR